MSWRVDTYLTRKARAAWPDATVFAVDGGVRWILSKNATADHVVLIDSLVEPVAVSKSIFGVARSALYDLVRAELKARAREGV
jgi:hypothetical protein